MFLAHRTISKTLRSPKFLLQYLEELLGSILFSWVACGVSLAALVEVICSFVRLYFSLCMKSVDDFQAIVALV